MNDEDELHPNARLVEHRERARGPEAASGDQELIREVSGHIQRHLGPIYKVFHERTSDLIHLDLHWLKPRPDFPFHTLVTSGMSQRPMRVPEGAGMFASYAELVLHLPDDWPMNPETWRNETHFWPLRLLTTLARMPHQYDTWLCMGHTVDNAGSPYSPDTRQCAALISPSVSTPEGFNTLELEGRRINFFSVVPLYKEELEFKTRKGAEALYAKLEEAEVDDVIQPNRPNVCAPKGILGWLRK